MLTIQETLFTQEYLQDLDDKKAQKRAGIHPYDPHLLENPDIRREIDRLMEEKLTTLQITSDYILSNLKNIVEDSLRPIPKSQMNKDGEQFFFTDPEGNMIFEKETSQALKALELLGKYKSLFTDKTENINVNTNFEEYLNKVTDESEW